MLFLLGALSFEIWPLNPTGTDSDSGGDYVEKPVMGRRPPLEFVGEATENFSFSAVLFPEKLGGLEKLDQLHAIRKSGIPQYLMRGDGKPLGWFGVTAVKEQGTYLSAKGVGQQINVEISLLRGDPPQDADYFASVIGMLE